MRSLVRVQPGPRHPGGEVLKNSDVVSALPLPARKALRALGSNISVARRRRRITMALMAERCFVSRQTIARMEKGDPSVNIATYITALFCLGMHEQMSFVAHPSGDTVGCILGADVPVRARVRGGAPGDSAIKPSTIKEWASIASKKTKISRDFLENLWRCQNGRCAMSGLMLRPTATGLFQPSLDRIDSKRGYSEDNVQIVLLSMNLMKNAQSQEAAQELISAMRWNLPN